VCASVEALIDLHVPCQLRLLAQRQNYSYTLNDGFVEGDIDPCTRRSILLVCDRSLLNKALGHPAGAVCDNHKFLDLQPWHNPALRNLQQPCIS
jgi:hypothetical protein